MLIAAASNGKALWYLTRGTGLVAMVLLSGSVALGVAEINRWTRPAFPRFVTAALHKNVSLLATVFLAVHIVTSIIDAFAPIRWIDVIIPLTSKYRPMWLGLGALATDLLIALVFTSLVRQRIGLRVWRIVHWTAYGCWPVAVAHGLGTGSDSRQPWALAAYAACLAVVIAAVWWRLAVGWRSPATAGRLAAIVGSVAVPLGLVGFLVIGPLRPGWAARAGTPRALIAGTSQAPSPAPAGSSAFAPPFTDELTGTITERPADRAGRSTVTIDATLTGQVSGVVHISLVGPADPGGGITMASSAAAVGPASDPREYQGTVTALRGATLQLSLTDRAGTSMTLSVRLRTSGAAVTGTALATA